MDSDLEQELKQRIDELQNGFVPPGPYQNDLIEVFTRCLEAIAEKDKKIAGLIKGQQILVMLHSKLSEEVIGRPTIKWVGFGNTVTPKGEQ